MKCVLSLRSAEKFPSEEAFEHGCDSIRCNASGVVRYIGSVASAHPLSCVMWLRIPLSWSLICC